MQPSTELVTPRKQSLVAINDELQCWKDTAAGVDDDGPDAALIKAKIAQLESLHTNKVDAYAALTKWLESEQAQLKKDRERFARRERAYAQLEQRLRSTALSVMRENQDPQLKGRAYTITLCDGKKRPEITDASLIPEQFILVVPQEIIPEHVVVDREAVEMALKRGEEVAGARLVDGEQFIQIR